jgi:CheY-like chemotaxis protein
MREQFSNDSSTRNNFKNARLILVEDDPDQGEIISKAIQHCLSEVKLTWLKTREETLDYFNQCPPDEWKSLKLILLDLYIPDREDGWEVLNRIQEQSTAQGKIPVVLLSYSDDQRDITEAYDRGCSSYVAKPSAYSEWLTYFETVRAYWWETVVLPSTKQSRKLL